MLKWKMGFTSCGLFVALLLAGAHAVAVGQQATACSTSSAAPHTPAPAAGVAGAQDWAGSFVPTPMLVVEKMLEVARVGERDKVFDLGSGDGRIVIMAAQKFGAESVGVELDEELVKQSSARIADLKLQGKVKILHADFFKTDLRSATVVMLYLVDSVNERLRPVFEKQLRPGTRVVVHDFRIPGWEPREVFTVTSEMGVPHKVYLYVKP